MSISISYICIFVYLFICLLLPISGCVDKACSTLTLSGRDIPSNTSPSKFNSAVAFVSSIKFSY